MVALAAGFAVSMSAAAAHRSLGRRRVVERVVALHVSDRTSPTLVVGRARRWRSDLDGRIDALGAFVLAPLVRSDSELARPVGRAVVAGAIAAPLAPVVAIVAAVVVLLASIHGNRRRTQEALGRARAVLPDTIDGLRLAVTAGYTVRQALDHAGIPVGSPRAQGPR